MPYLNSVWFIALHWSFFGDCLFFQGLWRGICKDAWTKVLKNTNVYFAAIEMKELRTQRKAENNFEAVSKLSLFLFTPLLLSFLVSEPQSQRWHCHILKHLFLSWHGYALFFLFVSVLLGTTQRHDMLEAHPGWVALLEERCGWQDQPSAGYVSNVCRQCITSPLETSRKSSAGNSE